MEKSGLFFGTQKDCGWGFYLCSVKRNGSMDEGSKIALTAHLALIPWPPRQMELWQTWCMRWIEDPENVVRLHEVPPGMLQTAIRIADRSGHSVWSKIDSVAQQAEHHTFNMGALGSSPSGVTTTFIQQLDEGVSKFLPETWTVLAYGKTRLRLNKIKIYFAFVFTLHYFAFGEDRLRFGKAQTKTEVFAWHSAHLALRCLRRR